VYANVELTHRLLRRRGGAATSSSVVLLRDPFADEVEERVRRRLLDGGSGGTSGAPAIGTGTTSSAGVILFSCNGTNAKSVLEVLILSAVVTDAN
jgi:hypothetical protein